MNIVSAGSRYQVYGEDVQTFKSLPAATYTVGFHPQMGFWLNKFLDISANEEVIYGTHQRRVEKIYKSFKLSTRNFGVILSGKKGIGKSLLARMIAEKGIEEGLPVIIVDSAIPGISDFLSSIQQEVVVIFDEFEKTFAKNKEGGKDPQVEMLSLFDGIDSGKKLFIITCNAPGDLNEFLINRPGRFHYHLEIKNPTAEEVSAYMVDKLGEGFDEEIEKVIKLSQMSDITYDCLRAITFDLRQGYKLEETLEDLNINYERDSRFDVTLRLSNGWIVTSYSNRINMYSKESMTIDFRKDSERFFVEFTPRDISIVGNTLTIKDPKEHARTFACWDAFDETLGDDLAEQKRQEYNKNVYIESITFSKIIYSSTQKYIDV